MHASTRAEDRLQDDEAQAENSKKFDELSSLNYTEFLTSAKDFVREKGQLYQALRAYESRLLKTLQIAKNEDAAQMEGFNYNEELYKTYSHLGHVHLLALDYAREFGDLAFFCSINSSTLIRLIQRQLKCMLVSDFANKCCGDYQQAYRHLRVALNNQQEMQIFSNSLIQLHIAHCFDLFGEFPRAKEEYRILLSHKPLPDDLFASAYRQLGWINFRVSLDREDKEEKDKLLAAAERSIQLALKRQPRNARSLCYLGRVVSQRSQEESANFAFENFRQAIDIDADSNTWFGIGELYLQQRQPLDALQAFACAVQLDRRHCTSWASLGRLYEKHRQFQHALHCYREAVQYAKSKFETFSGASIVI
ncbi:Histone demethylase UTY [Aphelenchoides bicaudatus]|nr:Histone demethylase UTY [Aphelenchoides bicaudatus]